MFNYCHLRIIQCKKRRNLNVKELRKNRNHICFNHLVSKKFTPSFTFDDQIKLWKQLTKDLEKLGPAKNVDNWKKCWKDMKGHVKRMASQVYKERNGTGGGSSTLPDLSLTKERIMGLIGGKFSALGNNEIPEFLNTSNLSADELLIEETVTENFSFDNYGKKDEPVKQIQKYNERISDADASMRPNRNTNEIENPLLATPVIRKRCNRELDYHWWPAMESKTLEELEHCCIDLIRNVRPRIITMGLEHGTQLETEMAIFESDEPRSLRILACRFVGEIVRFVEGDGVVLRAIAITPTMNRHGVQSYRQYIRRAECPVHNSNVAAASLQPAANSRHAPNMDREVINVQLNMDRLIIADTLNVDRDVIDLMPEEIPDTVSSDDEWIYRAEDKSTKERKQ